MRILTETEDDTIRILHVDDEPDFADMVSAFMWREDERFETETASSVADGLTRLANSQFDCVISDYDMPKQSGIEFLRSVREDYPEIPFILYTGKGSEEVASDAISAGATDYIQKETGSDHFKVLANRVTAVVERTRSERRHQQLAEAVETAREGIGILDEDGYHISVNQAYADIYRTTPDDLIGKHFGELCPENGVEYVRSEVFPAVQEEGYWSGRTTGLRGDGETFTQECALSTTTTGMTIHTVRDVSDQLKSEEQLSRYQALIEVLRDPVYVLDEEGQFDFVNDAFVETFGYEKHEILDNCVSVIKDERAIEQGLDNLRRVLSSDGADSVYFETEI